MIFNKVKSSKMNVMIRPEKQINLYTVVIYQLYVRQQGNDEYFLNMINKSLSKCLNDESVTVTQPKLVLNQINTNKNEKKTHVKVRPTTYCNGIKSGF